MSDAVVFCDECESVSYEGPRGPMLLVAGILALLNRPMICPRCGAAGSLHARPGISILGNTPTASPTTPTTRTRR